MKRTKFLIQSIFLTVLTCLTLLFASCTGKIEGIYKFESLCYNQNGISIEIKVNEKFMNTMTLTEDFTSLTLLEDGNAILSSSQLNLKDLSSLGIYQPDLYYGTWKKSDDNNKEIT